MHWKRVVVAAFALPLFYLCITKLSPAAFLVLLTVFSVLAQVEFYAMYKAGRTLSVAGIVTGALLLGSYYLSAGTSGLQAIVLMTGFMLISSIRLFMVKDPESSLKDLSPVITGLVYIPVLLTAQWFLRLRGYEWILLLYGCVWASDSLAYYIGKGMGKKKLYVEMSPNKTVAGAFGSVIGGMVSAALLGGLLLKDIWLPWLILTGGVVGAVTIVGDLVESMFKRDAGVKDSGSLIPGHGGILDKLDGVLFAGPVLYLITLLMDI